MDRVVQVQSVREWLDEARALRQLEPPDTKPSSSAAMLEELEELGILSSNGKRVGVGDRQERAHGSL